MTTQACLRDLRPGERAQITGILPSGLRQRLLDLGLVEGTMVECLYPGPWGDPVVYALRGMALALRAQDSQGILIGLIYT